MHPTHFAPTFSSAATKDSIFSLVYYHLPVHVTGAMYYHHWLILLALKNPALELDIPLKEGQDRIQAMRQCAQVLKNLDSEIRQNVRALCGIAVCNSYLAPAMTMASTALTICCEHFIDVEEREQEALLDLLQQNETKHGWPTGAARK